MLGPEYLERLMVEVQFGALILARFTVDGIPAFHA